MPQVEDRPRLLTAIAIGAALEGAVVGLVGAVLFIVPNPRQPWAFVEAVLPATALVAVLFAVITVVKHVRAANRAETARRLRSVEGSLLADRHIGG